MEEEGTLCPDVERLCDLFATKKECGQDSVHARVEEEGLDVLEDAVVRSVEDLEERARLALLRKEAYEGRVDDLRFVTVA